jgi:hypothetical protein
VTVASKDDSPRHRLWGLAGSRWRASARLRQIDLLLLQKVRLVRWRPTLGGAAVGLLILFQSSDGWATGSMSPVRPMRLAAVALCIGVVFLLDDAASVTVASVPAALRYRRGLRLLLAAPIVATAWVGYSAYVVVHTANLAHGDTAGLFPFWALTLEMAAMIMTALAIAAAATRWGSEGLGGVAAGPTMLALFGAALFLPHRWTLFPGSIDDSQWEAAHFRWAVIAVLATLLLVYFSRDPAARRPSGPRSRP